MHKYRQWRDGKHGLASGISAKPVSACSMPTEDSCLAADGMGYPRVTGRTLEPGQQGQGVQSFNCCRWGRPECCVQQ